MNQKTKDKIQEYVSDNIDVFHRNRIERIQALKLDEVLRNKNPYLFRAKNVNRAADLVSAIMDARLSSSEEGSFGGFLEDLAVYVAELTGGGQKSAAEGIDIDLARGKVRYLIAVKSGKNWGNADQHKALKRNFQRAVRVIRQGTKKADLRPTLGICYGSFRTTDTGEYLHIGGQSFWHLISGDRNLYIDIVEPLGFKAEEHNRRFTQEKDNVYTRMTREFIAEYCDPTGAINWSKLVEFVSGNLSEGA